MITSFDMQDVIYREFVPEGKTAENSTARCWKGY
jgi:hypothetical protein